MFLCMCKDIFKQDLTSKQRQALSQLILEYRQGIQPLLAPLTLINHYLSEYPDNYLSKQKILLSLSSIFKITLWFVIYINSTTVSIL